MPIEVALPVNYSEQLYYSFNILLFAIFVFIIIFSLIARRGFIKKHVFAILFSINIVLIAGQFVYGQFFHMQVLYGPEANFVVPVTKRTMLEIVSDYANILTGPMTLVLVFIVGLIAHFKRKKVGGGTNVQQN